MKAIIKSIVFLLIVSCSPEAPFPNDETVEKGHENWYKAVYRFTEGEKIDAPREQANFVGYEQDNSLTFKTVQEYTFISSENGLVIPDKTPIKLIEGKAYGLEAFYYNKNNELMNYEFTTEEMAPIHQHFFIPKSINSIKEGVEAGKKNNVLNYKYRDTEPDNQLIESSGVLLRPEKEPIGLKGYFTVEKAYQEFNLRVVLVHIISGSKLADDGTPYPFYAPSLRVLGTTDLSVNIPMKIFTSVNSPDFHQEIANEFNISKEKALKELNERKKGALKI